MILKNDAFCPSALARFLYDCALVNAIIMDYDNDIT